MAKVAFTKLGLKSKNNIQKININENEIEVKEYLPLEDKLDIMTSLVNAALESDIRYFNIPQILFNLKMEVLYKYTNISFTEKQKENPMKLYDIFESNGLFKKILEICEEDYLELYHWTMDIAEKVYNQRNSVHGILESLNTDYNNLSLDIDTLSQNISNPENLSFLKDVLSKLG